PIAAERFVGRADDGMLRYAMAAEPMPPLREASRAVGLVNILLDGDGAARRMALVLRAGEETVPAMALTAAARYLRRPATLEAPPSAGALPFAGRLIPVDDAATTRRAFAGPPGAVPHVSLSVLLSGGADPAMIRDRVVFIGMTAGGFGDDFWTPASTNSKMFGVEIHAQATEQILRGAFLSEQDRTGSGLSTLALALLAVPLALRARPLLALGGALAAAVWYVLLVFLAFDRGLLLDLVFPPLGFATAFVALLAYRVVGEQAEQRALRAAMARYLSPAVTAEVLKDPERLRLGGQKRTMTTLFSDIRGFTNLAERLSAEEVVELLNEYFTAMTDVLFRHDAVLDKYMGDAIMAFWGAPLRQPDHARRACLAALDMLAALEALRARWRAAGRPAAGLAIGVGINTGEMIVGNMGAERRLDYTVLGDAVNLASRLEGLNKEYGTSVIASAATLGAAGPNLPARFLDTVVVKGRAEPVDIFELRPADQGSAAEEAQRHHEAGLAHYRGRRFGEAAAAFRAALALDPDDGPAALYVARAEALLADPPAADWDGVYVAKTK
ncbi:MAG: adenylate/guanylate cyclase domain-containing protein, partial [Chloroflexi bacterium]|nr:adenylate/guanylate cyclase domain-containing protein [Chloroflexota bacterium]